MNATITLERFQPWVVLIFIAVLVSSVSKIVLYLDTYRVIVSCIDFLSINSNRLRGGRTSNVQMWIHFSLRIGCLLKEVVYFDKCGLTLHLSSSTKIISKLFRQEVSIDSEERHAIFYINEILNPRIIVTLLRRVLVLSLSLVR